MRRFLQIAETTLALIVAWCLVFALPFRVAVTLLSRGQDAPFDAAHVTAGNGLGRRIRRLAPRMPFKTTCLVRAMAGWLMLRRRGMPGKVRFGVRMENGELKAHAWLIVHETTVLGGEEAEGYTPIGDFGLGRETAPRVWSDA